MTLRTRATDLTELMDDQDCDSVRLRRTLERFSIVNRLVGGWAREYRNHIRPLLALCRGSSRILDIGCGSGDVLRGLVRMARNDGFEIEALGIDPDPRALEVARAAKAVKGVRYRDASSGSLVDEGETFEIVISNHLLHHLDDDALRVVLRDSELLTNGIALHSDIARGRIAYGAYAVGILPLAPGSLLLTDGLRSIRRSYTQEELAAALPRGWEAQHPHPFRLLAVHRSARNTS